MRQLEPCLGHPPARAQFGLPAEFQADGSRSACACRAGSGDRNAYSAFSLRAASIAESRLMWADTLRGGVDERSTT